VKPPEDQEMNEIFGVVFSVVSAAQIGYVFWVICGSPLPARVRRWLMVRELKVWRDRCGGGWEVWLSGFNRIVKKWK